MSDETVKSTFNKVNDDYDETTGGERHIRLLSDVFWVSVLHRFTGFGHWEWETVIVRVREDNDPLKYKRGRWDDRELFTVVGDHRQALANKTETEIMEWYKKHSNEKTSFYAVMDAISSEVEDE